MTRLIFKKGHDTLANREVRLCSLTNEEVFQTDQDGAIELELEPGIHWFKLLTRQKNWLYTTLQLDADTHLIEINLTELREQGHTGPVYSSHRHLQQHLSALEDRFELRQILGRGGMGIVLKARDKMLGRWVALKIKHRQFTDHQRAKKLLLREAQRLAQLRHPNLIAIYDVVAVGDDVVLITEFVDGHSIDHVLHHTGPIKQQTLLRYAIQLARVLTYIHDRNYVHRDIKPANLMVEADGTIKLIDFGLAAPLEHTRDVSTVTNHTSRKGTPQYMAPEQFRGVTQTAKTDMYQLGITLYEMATGHLPYDGPNWANAHAKDTPKTLKHSSLSPQFAQLIEQCMAKNPKNRITSAKKLLTHLQQLYVVQGYEDSKPQLKRHPLKQHMAWIVALLMLAFSLGWLLRG